MAHFAKIDNNNLVSEVVVIPDEQEHRGEAFLCELGFNGKWIQTSYNASIRKIYAYPGCFYNPELDRFEPPKPYESWVFDEKSYDYNAPVPYPDDGNDYDWDEATLSWVARPEPEITEEETDAN